jgi:outer membrane receptor protein involved in Fe transport
MKKNMVFFFLFLNFGMFSQNIPIERKTLIFIISSKDSNQNNNVHTQIVKGLEQKFSNSEYDIRFSTDSIPKVLENTSPNDLIVYLKYKHKNKTLSLYSQTIDPTNKKLIDAFNVTSEIEGIDENLLPKEEFEGEEQKKIDDFSDKLWIKIKSNPDKKEKRQNLDEFFFATLIQNELPELQPYIIQENLEAASGEIFKLFEEQTVITATKKEEKLSDAPASMTVITAEDIRRYGYRSLPEALARVPEVYVHYQGHNEGANFRGFFANNVSRRVLYLLNGMKLNDRFHFGDFYPDVISDLTNVERIEVIRGPGASLYGNNSVLGVVNIITKQATEKNSTTLLGGFSNVRKNALTGKLQVVHNKKYSDNISFMADVSHYDGKMLYDTQTGWDGGVNRPGFVDLSYSTDAYFRADNTTTRSSFVAGQRLPNFHVKADFYDFTIGAFMYTRRTTWVWPKDNNTFAHSDNDRVWGTGSFYIQYNPKENFLSKLDFKSTLSYDINTNREVTDFDWLKSRGRVGNVGFGANQRTWIKMAEGSYINYIQLTRQLNHYLSSNSNLDAAMLTRGGGTRFIYHGVDKTVSGDFQITPYQSKDFMFMTGGNALTADYSNYQRFTFRNNETIGFSRFGGISDKGWAGGAWMQGIYSATEKLSITTGVRYDYQYVATVYRQLGGVQIYDCVSQNGASPNEPAIEVENIPRDGQFGCKAVRKNGVIAKDVTPRIAFNYRFNVDHNIRLLYGEAFRAVPPQELIRLVAEAGEAKSEKTKNYEIIYAGRFYKNFTATTNAFYLKGAQIYAYNPAFMGFSAASGWDNTGGSIALKWLSRGFQLWSNTTLYKLRRSIDSYSFATYPGTATMLNTAFGTANNPYPNGIPLKEKRPLDSPQFLLKIGGSYDFPDKHTLSGELYHNGVIQEVHPARNNIDYINGQLTAVNNSTGKGVYELYEKYKVPASTFVDITYSKIFDSGLRFLFKVHNIFNKTIYYALPVDAEGSFGNASPNAVDPYSRAYEKPHRLPGFGRLYNFEITYTF